jgi:molybdenum cofactor cytidylyltransferase
MTGIIILAAGESSRMGRPKQQLPYQQQTLLQRAVHTAVSIADARVWVVLGAHYDAIKEDIATLPVQVIHNTDWQSGMGSSVSAGMQALLAEYAEASNVLIMLCDQPYVDTTLINTLLNAQNQVSNRIAACTYQGTLGVPAVFGRSYFNELLGVRGQDGAKKLLLKHESNVIKIPFENGRVDIDTAEDYQRLLNL